MRNESVRCSLARASACALTMAALVMSPAVARAADPAPDVKGKWVGKTHTIVAGSGGHWPNSKGTFEKPAFFDADVVIEVTGQEGRRFWGMTTITGDSGRTDEPFIGQLTGAGNRDFVVADTDGFFTGQLVGADTLTFCYMQAASGKTPASVVSCSEVKRAR